MRLLFFIACLDAVLLGGCMAHDTAALNRGVTADDKEVTARNLAACRTQAEAAKLSAQSSSYSRYIDECMRKGGVVEQTTR
jgi:hypothetical protein